MAEPRWVIVLDDTLLDEDELACLTYPEMHADTFATYEEAEAERRQFDDPYEAVYAVVQLAPPKPDPVEVRGMVRIGDEYVALADLPGLIADLTAVQARNTTRLEIAA